MKQLTTLLFLLITTLLPSISATALQASWVHGNALTCELPQNLVSPQQGHYGWGADYTLRAGQNSWFHIPVPTPVIVNNVRSTFTRFFFMFEIPGGGYIDQVHIYDGSTKIQEFDGLNLRGAHRTGLDGVNTFYLSTPHTVLWGIGITVNFQADNGVNSRMIVGSAGVDFFA